MEIWTHGILILHPIKPVRKLAIAKCYDKKGIESAITKMFGENFSLRFIVKNNQDAWMGIMGLQRSFIGSLARCNK
jgi:hypothetical protein